MKELTTQEAFRELLSTPGISDTLSMAESSIRNWKRRLNGNGYKIKIETMEAALLKAGWKVVAEKKWRL